MQLKRAQGATLFEIMLVLVVAGTILALVIRQYNGMRSDADVEQAKYIVDQLFGAAADYYHANCRIPIDPVTGAIVGTTGTLDPAYSPAPSNPYPVTVNSLKPSGYLAISLPLNSLVNNNGTNGGYIVQFNQSPPTNRLVNGNIAGKVITWRIQVAVELNKKT